MSPAKDKVVFVQYFNTVGHCGHAPNQYNLHPLLGTLYIDRNTCLSFSHQHKIILLIQTDKSVLNLNHRHSLSLQPAT